MSVPGPWRDDSLPVWLTTASGGSEDVDTSYGWMTEKIVTGDPNVAWNDAVVAAWAGPTTLNTYTPSFFVQKTRLPDGARAVWGQTFVTISRDGDTTVAVGTLPSTVVDEFGNFLNPRVIGVEWEPVDAPDTQRMVVTVRRQVSVPAITDPTSPIYVKYETPLGTPHAPAFRTGAQLAGLPTLATFYDPTSESFPPPTVTIDGPPLPLTGPTSLAITLLDEYTQAQSPPDPAAWEFRQSQYPFDVTLQASYTPRFRLIYAGGRIAHNRGVQRGSDGQGVTGGKRGLQRTSRQSSLRGGSFL